MNVQKLMISLFFFGILAILFLLQPKIMSRVQAATFFPKLRTIIQREHKPVCSLHFQGMAWCNAHVSTDTSGHPLQTTSPLSSSYGPAQFHTAYSLPCTPGGPIQSVCPSPTTFGGTTIAIIVAYNAPNIENDLKTYSTYYGLPACTRANGCLSIVNQNGGSNLPASNSGWALEASLDVEVAHMICQTCKILLVEANDSYVSNLGIAVNTATRLGARVISNSYGSSEWSGEPSYESSYYNHPGVVIVAASGDNGYGVEFPAASPHVVATGGTTLQLNAVNNYVSEAAWSSAGSGCSVYEQADISQKNITNWAQTNCGNFRGVADVSADADPNTGAAVYDSTPYAGTSGWYQIGGTSLATPLIAGMYALAGGIPANTNASSLLYASFSGVNAHDISTGSNGACNSIMCNAAVGYDGPTGLGSPNGLGGFTQTILQPTPTLTGAPSPTAANTPTPTQPPLGQLFTFGYTAIGNRTDTFDQNHIDGSRFKMGSANGTLKSISVNVGTIDSVGHNQYQVALYTDNNGKPGTLIATSASGQLIANSWNTLTIISPLQANTYYWLMYNTNSSIATRNNLRFTNTSIAMGTYSTSSIAFGAWPQTFTSNLDGYEYSIYASYITP